MDGQLSWIHYAPEAGQTQSRSATKMKPSEKRLDGHFHGLKSRPGSLDSYRFFQPEQGPGGYRFCPAATGWCHNHAILMTEKSLESSPSC
ncbi:MAG: hypothetical protein Q7T70_08005, partial [Polaromonas sp.]|nr:hypothetical protein [Polaromonas sp.]